VKQSILNLTLLFTLLALSLGYSETEQNSDSSLFSSVASGKIGPLKLGMSTQELLLLGQQQLIQNLTQNNQQRWSFTMRGIKGIVHWQSLKAIRLDMRSQTKVDAQGKKFLNTIFQSIRSGMGHPISKVQKSAFQNGIVTSIEQYKFMASGVLATLLIEKNSKNLNWLVRLETQQAGNQRHTPRSKEKPGFENIPYKTI